MKILQTSSGVRFGLMGEKGARPAATLFALAADLEVTLSSDDYAKSARLLQQQGFQCVSLDVPCHGADRREGEPEGLLAWRSRIEAGDNLVDTLSNRVADVLDFLVREKYTDPQRVAIEGTSRGGFMALHVAAAEPRIRCAVAFAPVTDLPVLKEFKGLEKHALTRSLAAGNLADKLAGRPVWVCIGNNDQRVGTDQCIAFTRRLVAASLAQGKPAPVELHVMQTEGHGIHKTAHEEAAAWVAARIHRAG